MQGPFLTITIGIQFFVLVGYLLYFVFRTWSSGEDQIALMSWTAVLVGFLTLWILVSVLLVSSSMSLVDIILAGGIITADILGLYLLVDDTLRKRKVTIAQDFGGH
ncbi:MAG: hypothetical protein ACXABV_18000 [Candidatus Thorarchaeota archaeon]|jgi:hypothetical protein